MYMIKMENGLRPWLASKAIAEIIETNGIEWVKVNDYASGSDRITVGDTLTKIRRRIEDRLRKDPQSVLNVMDYLEIWPKTNL